MKKGKEYSFKYTKNDGNESQKQAFILNNTNNILTLLTDEVGDEVIEYLKHYEAQIQAIEEARKNYIRDMGLQNKYRAFKPTGVSQEIEL